MKGVLFLTVETSKREKYDILRRKTDEEYGAIINHFGLSGSSMMILWTLSLRERPCTQKEICDEWFENKQTINSAVKRLIAEGIIDIAPSAENSREKLLSFTEKGRFLAMRTVGRIIEAERTAFESLSEEEQAEAIRISEKHYEILKREFKKIKGEKE